MERQDGFFTESSLADSVVFKAFNNQAEFSTILNESIKKSTIIESSLIEEQLGQMKRTRLSPLVDTVLDAYKNGDIVLLYSKTIRIPKMIPFTVIKLKGEKKAFVFLNNYGNLVEKGKAVGGEYFNIFHTFIRPLHIFIYIIYRLNKKVNSFFTYCLAL